MIAGTDMPQPEPNFSVLVVEDDGAIRRGLADALRYAGYGVLERLLFKFTDAQLARAGGLVAGGASGSGWRPVSSV